VPGPGCQSRVTVVKEESLFLLINKESLREKQKNWLAQGQEATSHQSVNMLYPKASCPGFYTTSDLIILKIPHLFEK
jgi:hypothetical protein